jgi:hypothetical protein
MEQRGESYNLNEKLKKIFQEIKLICFLVWKLQMSKEKKVSLKTSSFIGSLHIPIHHMAHFSPQEKKSFLWREIESMKPCIQGAWVVERVRYWES